MRYGSCYLWLLLGLCRSPTATAWIPSMTTKTTKYSCRRRQVLLALHANDNNNEPEGIFFNDDECIDLCDILDTEPEVFHSVTKDDVNVNDNVMMEDADFDRRRLILHWQVRENTDDCDLDQVETCALPCETCRGRGQTTCRFCTGSKVVSFIPGNVMDCPVCNKQGTEVCSCCHGSGWVAPWLSLAKIPVPPKK
jgi:hypothetical protein